MIRYKRELGAGGVVLAIVALTIIGWSAGPRKAAAANAQITIAAAANLTDVFGKLGPRFEAETGIHPVFSFASTAQLTQQIENSAPFDLFAAADSEHVAKLEKEKLLVPGSRAIYAVGVLAMWIPPGSKAAISRPEELGSPNVRVIAVAKPELAPYGQAAENLLEKLPGWPRIKPKIVYAENISMAKQYGMSKNADVVFTAYSLVLHESGKVVRLGSEGLQQELGILAASKQQAEARKFSDFLIRGNGRQLLSAYGYETGLK